MEIDQIATIGRLLQRRDENGEQPVARLRATARRCRRVGAVVVVSMIVASVIGSAPGFGHTAGGVSFNGTSRGGSAPAIVVRHLIASSLDALPLAPLVVDIHRATISPTGGMSLVSESGLLALFVDAGAISTDIAGEAMLTGPIVPVTGKRPDPVSVSGTVAFEYSEYLVVPPGVEVRTTNDGHAPAELLIVSIQSLSVSHTFDYVETPEGLVHWEELVRTVFAKTPSLPVYLVVSRVVYAPGVAESTPTENGGPLAIVIEDGTVGYHLASGTAVVVPASHVSGRPVEPGEEVVLIAGTSVVEEWGTVSRIRNLTSERAWVLALTLVPVELPENRSTLSDGR